VRTRRSSVNCSPFDIRWRFAKRYASRVRNRRVKSSFKLKTYIGHGLAMLLNTYTDVFAVVIGYRYVNDRVSVTVHTHTHTRARASACERNLNKLWTHKSRNINIFYRPYYAFVANMGCHQFPPFPTCTHFTSAAAADLLLLLYTHNILIMCRALRLVSVSTTRSYNPYTNYQTVPTIRYRVDRVYVLFLGPFDVNGCSKL
jgi:hypothetical protein